MNIKEEIVELLTMALVGRYVEHAGLRPEPGTIISLVPYAEKQALGMLENYEKEIKGE